MYAVVKSGGKQYRVEEGSELVVEKIDAGVGDSVDFDVLFYSDGANVVVDPDAAGTASVTAEVVEQFRGDKVIVFKFKKRKGYKRTRGHRQSLTRVKVTGIAAPKPGAKKKAAPKPKAEPKAEAKVEAPAKKAEPKAEKPAKKAEPKPKAEAPAKKAEPKVEAAAEPTLCAATTGSGDPCKNKAKEGSKYCGVHAKKYDG